MSDPFPTDDNLRMQYMTRHGNGHAVEIHLWSSKQRLIETDLNSQLTAAPKRTCKQLLIFFILCSQVGEWVRESVSRWVNDKLVNNEWMTGWTDEWVNGWTGEHSKCKKKRAQLHNFHGASHGNLRYKRRCSSLQTERSCYINIPSQQHIAGADSAIGYQKIPIVNRRSEKQ